MVSSGPNSKGSGEKTPPASSLSSLFAEPEPTTPKKQKQMAVGIKELMGLYAAGGGVDIDVPRSPRRASLGKACDMWPTTPPRKTSTGNEEKSPRGKGAETSQRDAKSKESSVPVKSAASARGTKASDSQKVDPPRNTQPKGRTEARKNAVAAAEDLPEVERTRETTRRSTRKSSKPDPPPNPTSTAPGKRQAKLAAEEKMEDVGRSRPATTATEGPKEVGTAGKRKLLEATTKDSKRTVVKRRRPPPQNHPKAESRAGNAVPAPEQDEPTVYPSHPHEEILRNEILEVMGKCRMTRQVTIWNHWVSRMSSDAVYACKDGQTVPYNNLFVASGGVACLLNSALNGLKYEDLDGGAPGALANVLDAFCQREEQQKQLSPGFATSLVSLCSELCNSFWLSDELGTLMKSKILECVARSFCDGAVFTALQNASSELKEVSSELLEKLDQHAEPSFRWDRHRTRFESLGTSIHLLLGKCLHVLSLCGPSCGDATSKRKSVTNIQLMIQKGEHPEDEATALSNAFANFISKYKLDDSSRPGDAAKFSLGLPRKELHSALNTSLHLLPQLKAAQEDLAKLYEERSGILQTELPSVSLTIRMLGMDTMFQPASEENLHQILKEDALLKETQGSCIARIAEILRVVVLNFGYSAALQGTSDEKLFEQLKSYEGILSAGV